MDVNSVNTGMSSASTYNATTTTNSTTTATTGTTDATNAANNPNANEAAIYEASGAANGANASDPSTATGTANSTYKPDAGKIRQMLEESERQSSAFRKLIEGLFNKQATKAGQAAGTITENLDFSKGVKEFVGSLEVDAETQAQAQKDIEAGGYYSVEETAKRILDFAVALSGGDPNKIDTLRKAVEDGFTAAMGAWGDELPEISQKTFDAVMQGFDEWKAAGSASAISLLKSE